MGKILDLSVFMEETLDIKMLDGQMLHIKKPEQRMVIEMMKFREIGDDTAPEKVTAALNRMVWMILNNNQEGVWIGAEAIDALSMDMKSGILTAYAQFATRLQQNPI